MPVSAVEVIDCYSETGLSRLYAANSVLFYWDSWLLCETRMSKDSLLHMSICTNFRSGNPLHDVGPCKRLTADVWNPNYDDDRHTNTRIELFDHWRPVACITHRISQKGELST